MNNRERGDAVEKPAVAAVQSEPKFWQGTNFWIAAAMAIGSLWGLKETDVAPIITGVFGLIGAAFALREKIKSTTIDVKAWASSPNTWNYVVAAIAAAVTTIPTELGSAVSGVIQAVIGKNWPSLITALLSLGSIIYFWVTGGKGLFKAKA